MSAIATGLAHVALPGLVPWREGKVRSVYDAGPGHLVIVASDRLSAYDHVLSSPIPDKGRILTQMSVFWFGALASAQPHHFVSADPHAYPRPFSEHAAALEGRSMLVRRAQRVDVECVVRGYLTGSGWREYRRGGSVCGIALPAGLHDGAPLPEPLFTPASKVDDGHDLNIPFDDVVGLVGVEVALALRERSLALYREAHAHARARGLVLADTKFEFGWIDGRLTLIDEVLSPDSSRFWDREAWESGRLESFDKQIVRDWLDRSGWDHESKPPGLPDEVVQATRERYLAAMARLTGPAR